MFVLSLPLLVFLGVRGAHVLRSGHNGLEELDFVGAVVLVLVLVAPKRILHLLLGVGVLLEHVPLVSVKNYFLEDLVTGPEAPQITNWTGCSLMD